MRIYLRLAAAATSALVIALPMTAEAATAHVLTINKKGGPAVKPGAILKAGLLTGTKAVFSLGSGTGKLTCSSGKLVTKVATNPVRPGKATGSVTAQSFSSCVLSGAPAGVTFKSLKSANMPFHFTVSDATGDPVAITGQSSTKPVNFTSTVSFNGGDIACTFKSAKVAGHATAGNTVTFTKQKFTFASGSIFCPATAFFTATFGPVKDTSVTGSPRVFVN